MDSTYIDLTDQLINVDTTASLQAGSKYRIQCTGAGEPIESLQALINAYLVLATAEPTDLAAAKRSAIILQPGREPYVHTVDASRPLWAFSPQGTNSISINPA